MLNVYFSHPFDDKPGCKSRDRRKELKNKLEKVFDDEINILEEHFNFDITISEIAKADLVVFSHDWKQSPSCQIEMQMCKEFKRPYTILRKEK